MEAETLLQWPPNFSKMVFIRQIGDPGAVSNILLYSRNVFADPGVDGDPEARIVRCLSPVLRSPTSSCRRRGRKLPQLVGCSIGSGEHKAATIVVEALSPFSGKLTSMLLRTNKHGDTPLAMLNGIMSHVHEYDDMHLKTVIHPAGRKPLLRWPLPGPGGS